MEDGSQKTLMERGECMKASMPGLYASPALCRAVPQLERAMERGAHLLAERFEAERKAVSRLVNDMLVHARQVATSAAVRNYLVTRQAQPHPKRQARARGGELAAWRAQQRAGARNGRP